MHDRPLARAASSASSLAPAAATSASPTSGWSTVTAAACTAQRATSVAHRHVGAEVLDGLERTDGPAELPALLGVLDGELGGPGRRADLEGGGEHRPVPSPPRGDRRDRRPASPGRQVATRPHRGERVHRPLQPGDASRAAGSSERDAVVGQRPAARRGRRGARRPAGSTGGRRVRPGLDQADHHRAVVGPVDQPGGQVGGDQWSGHQGPAQLLEDEGRLGQPEADPAGLLGQAEIEHPGLAELRASPSGRPPGRPPRAARSRSRGNRPSHSRRMPSASSVWNSVSSKSIGSSSELGRRSAASSGSGGVGSLGRPRMRSPTMLRWICEVPAAMVSEMPRSQSSTMVSAGSGPSPSAAPRSSAASPARPSRESENSPSRLRVSV